LLEFLRSHYVSPATILAIAGNVTHRQALQAVARYGRFVHRGTLSDCAPVTVAQRAPQVCLFSKNTEQTQLAIGIRTCSRHDERRFPVRLLNTVLGENMSSRLFQLIREEKGLAYSIYSSPSFFHDTGDLVISAGLDTDNLEKTLRMISGELRRLTQSVVSKSELRHARDYVIGQIELGEESTENQMNWVGEQLVGYGKIHEPNEAKRHLSKVTGGQIRGVARDFFHAEHLNLALVSPLKSAGGLERTLKLT
jgi:predicted Zn-dependent peptidase